MVKYSHLYVILVFYLYPWGEQSADSSSGRAVGGGKYVKHARRLTPFLSCYLSLSFPSICRVAKVCIVDAE